MTNTPETRNILNPDFRMPEHCGGDRWSILHGDSLQILRQFEPNSFDAIITDPPYASGGSSQTTKNRSTNEKYSSMSKEKALPDFDSDQMDQLSWMFWTAAWLQDARRIAKPGAPVCLFIDWRQLPAMTLALQWAGWTWRGVAVWDKVAKPSTERTLPPAVPSTLCGGPTAKCRLREMLGVCRACSVTRTRRTASM